MIIQVYHAQIRNALICFIDYYVNVVGQFYFELLFFALKLASGISLLRT